MNIVETYKIKKHFTNSVAYEPKNARSILKNMTVYVPRSALPEGEPPETLTITVSK